MLEGYVRCSIFSLPPHVSMDIALMLSRYGVDVMGFMFAMLPERSWNQQSSWGTFGEAESSEHSLTDSEGTARE